MSPSPLSDRLKGIIGPPARPAERSAPADASGTQLAESLGGEWRGQAGRRCFVVERRMDAEGRHGRVRVGDIAASQSRAASFAPVLAAGLPARPPLVFFDLETTGLSGGAGTLAFLVGFGWFDDEGGFVTRQYLLTQFGEERGLLNAVADELAGAGALVSFNGKSFDAPLLESRFLFHRLDWAGASLPHIDVLHPSRRFWREYSEHLPNCSLGALESQLFGVRRVGDLAGFEVPSRFFAFVRSGDPKPLGPVLEHNRKDLLSLASITGRLLTLLADGPQQSRDAAEALALGRAYSRAGLEARANESFEHALALMESAAARKFSKPLLRIEALRALACAARRGGRYESAAARWRQVLEISGCPPNVVREATEALAIHNEHRARDLTAARTFALRSLQADARPAWHDAVQHRLARIERKIERTAAWPPSLLETISPES